MHIVVRSPFVQGRSELSFLMGSCPVSNVVVSKTLCLQTYDLYLNWTQFWKNDCISGTPRTNGDMEEYLVMLRVVYTESTQKRDLGNAVTQNLAFRVELPTQVAVRSLNEVYLSPRTIIVKALVVSRTFDASTYTGVLVLRTKTQAPSFLIAPKLSNTLSGITSAITQIGNFSHDCSNSSLDCFQEWQIVSWVDPEVGICKWNEAFTVRWNTSCHDSCSNSGLHFLPSTFKGLGR